MQLNLDLTKRLISLKNIAKSRFIANSGPICNSLIWVFKKILLN